MPCRLPIAFFSAFLEQPELSGKTITVKMKVFKERYPEYAPYLSRKNNEPQPTTPQQLAIRLLVAKEAISERTIRAALTKSKRK